MNNSMASSGGAGANYALKQAKKEEQEVQSLAFFLASLQFLFVLYFFCYDSFIFF